MAKSDKKVSAEAVDARLENISKTLTGKGGKVMFNTMGTLPEPEYVKTGITSLDSSVSKVGGFPMGTIVEVFGKQSSGKTYTALKIAQAAQAMGKRVLFCDVERAFNPARATEIGIVDDGNFIVASNFSYGEEVWDIVHQAQESGEFEVFIIDSVGALFSRKELDPDAEKEAQMMVRAKMNKRNLAKCVSLVDSRPDQGKNHLVILINHVIATGDMYGPDNTTPGGEGIKYFSNIRMEIAQFSRFKKEAQIYNEDGARVGTRARCAIYKTRMNKPEQVAEIPIYFEPHDESDLWASLTDEAQRNEVFRQLRKNYVYPWDFSKKALSNGEEGIVADTIEEFQDACMADSNYYLIKICKDIGAPEPVQLAEDVAAFIVESRKSEPSEVKEETLEETA